MLKPVNVCVLIQFIMRDISQTSHVGGGGVEEQFMA